MFSTFLRGQPAGNASGLNGEEERRLRAEERRKRELAYWLREGWRLVVKYDFANATALAKPLQGFWTGNAGHILASSHPIAFEHGVLRLCPHPLWTGIAWAGELSEEIKIEVVAANSSPEGLNLAIALSGDIHHGYRLRLVRYDDIALENDHQRLLGDAAAVSRHPRPPRR